MHSSVAPEAFLSRFADRAVKPFREFLVLAGVGVRVPAAGVAGGDGISVTGGQDVGLMSDRVDGEFVKEKQGCSALRGVAPNREVNIDQECFPPSARDGRELDDHDTSVREVPFQLEVSGLSAIGGRAE